MFLYVHRFMCNQKKQNKKQIPETLLETENVHDKSFSLLALSQQLAFVVVLEMRVELTVKLQQAADSTKVALVLEEQRLQGALGPVVHGVREQFHRDRVHAQEVADEDHPIDFLIAGAHPRNRTDIVRDSN